MTRRDAHASGSLKRGWPPQLLRHLESAVPQRMQPVVTSRWTVIVASLVAFCGVTAVLAFVIAGGSGPASSGPRPVAYASPNPDTTEPAPEFHVPAPVAPIALPSTGAVPMPSSGQPQVKAWKAGSGGTALSAVTSEAGDVAQASGLKQYVQMKQACVQLASGVSTAQSDPPIPDAAMQAQYQKALSELAQAASKCQAAISEQPDGDEYVATTQNAGDLSASASALASGSTDLYKATGQISDLGQGQ